MKGAKVYRMIIVMGVCLVGAIPAVALGRAPIKAIYVPLANGSPRRGRGL